MATTAAAKERNLLKAHVQDEAKKISLARGRDSGSVHWEGNHLIIANSPEYAADIESRMNTRMATPQEEFDAHRIDFFMNGETYSDTRAIRYTTLMDRTGWTAPKNTVKPRFNYTNPNPTTSTNSTPTETEALKSQIAEQNDQISFLSSQLATQALTLDKLLKSIPTPPAEAERNTDK
jgi:hypothetical protein